MEGRRPGGASRGSWRTKQEESSSEFLQPDTWPVEAAHLAPALRGLGPLYCLPRVHLKPGIPPRSSPALVWAQECGDNWISVYKDGGVSSLPRTSCKRLLRRQRSASDGEKHRITEVDVDPQIELRETELSPPRWPRPLLVTKEQLLIERLRNQALHRSLLSLSSYSSSSETSSSSPSSDSLPSCSCCLANLRTRNISDSCSPSAFTTIFNTKYITPCPSLS